MDEYAYLTGYRVAASTLRSDRRGPDGGMSASLPQAQTEADFCPADRAGQKEPLLRETDAFLSRSCAS